MNPTDIPSDAPTNIPTNLPTTKATALPTTKISSGDSCYPFTKLVKLEATTKNQLNMFEVKVFSQGVNIAPEGNAAQSYTLSNFEASRAIDNNEITFSHTKKTIDDSKSWWQVDLTQAFEIESIEIENRWCQDSSDPKDCLCRLSNAELSLIDANGSVVVTKSTGDTCGKSTVKFTFEPSSGCNMPSEEVSVPNFSFSKFMYACR